MPYGSTTARAFMLASLLGSAKRAGAPGTLYAALCRQATPGDVSTVLGTEPDSTGDYARVAFTNDDAFWTLDGAGLGTNDVELRWPLATGLYSITGALNQLALYDNTTGGTCWLWVPLSTTITVTGAGDQPVIGPGSLDLTQVA